MQFDLTDLRLFVQVAEQGSLTAGAAHAHLSLAAASERVRDLERDLGQPLLLRGRRGVTPTPAGQAFAQQARLVLQQIAQLRGTLAEHVQGLRGQVRLLANTAALSSILPDLLAPYLRNNPGIDLELEERPSQVIPQALAQGRAELGLLADHAGLLDLEWRPFATDRLVVAAPPGHRLARRKRITLAELLGEDFIGLESGSALQSHLALQAERLGGQLRLRARLRGFDAVCRLVAAGAGLAILPEAAALRGRGAPGGPLLHLLRLTDSWAERRLLLCARSFAALPPPAARLADALSPPDAP